MFRYFYRGLDREGEMQVGELEALTTPAAVAELRKRGLTPVEVNRDKKTFTMRLNEPVTIFNKPGLRDVFALLRDLARLLRAGLAIDDAMKLLVDMQNKELLKATVLDMREHLRRGETLAATMSEHKGLFSVQVIASVHAGEQSGSLPDALETVSTALDRSLSFRERLRSALIYPSILMLMVAFTFILVMTFVLPQFAPLFDGNEEKLPFLTRTIMTMSHWFTSYWGFFAIGLGGFLTVMVWLFQSKQVKASFFVLLCRIPFMRDWLLTPELIRFIRTLGVCSKSGIALDKAIAMAIEAVNIHHIREELLRVRADVRRGETLSIALSRLGWFPALPLQFSRVGEQSGKIGVMFEEAAILMGQDFEARLEKALSVLSPVLTLIMGGIVAMLLGSVLLGIMSINDVAF